MKSLLAILLTVTLGFTGAAYAEGFNDGNNTINRGGYENGTSGVVTIEKAKELPDDAWVTLRGNIVEQVGGEDYLLKDATGTIKIEIDHKYWQGRTVKATDLVEISGTIDKEWYSIKVDAKNINVISKK